MLIWPDCIPCTLRMSMNIARIAVKDEAQITEFTKEVLKLDYYSGSNWNITSPEIIRDVWFIMQTILGVKDPLKQMKKEQNNSALKIYPYAKKYINNSSDPFLESLKFAISGNSIDIMTGSTKKPSKKIIKELQKGSINLKQVDLLKERLNRAKSVVYFGDNCGEIVFDKLLIETIREYYDLKITFITRTIPVLNDATMEDALYVGLDKAAAVIDNGTDEPIPGTILKTVSPEVKKLVSEADLVISKGGGNYDSLSEEKSLIGKCTFLIQSKCEPYSALHKIPIGDLIVDNY